MKTNGDDTTSSYDGMEIKLSKKSGLVKLLNFYAFGSDNEEVLKNLTYSGSQNLKDGMYNITAKEIYNYEVGDVFHRKRAENGPSVGTNITSTIDSIISKSISTIIPENKLVYIYKIFRIKKTLKGSIVSQNADTITESHVLNEINYFSLLLGYYSGSNKITKTIENGATLSGSSPCLNPVLDGGICANTYVEGLGGPYYFCRGTIDFLYHTYDSLIYYKKGNEEWGKALILGNSEEETLQSQITVSPNPTSGFVNFDLGNVSNACKIDLMDNSGKIVHSETSLGFTKIDVSSFKKGMYFYSISSENNKRLIGKLIVE